MKALTTAIFHALSKVADLFAPPIPQAYHEPWQRTRLLIELPPAEIQTTGGMRLPIYDGKHWSGPAGTLTALSRGVTPHRARHDTGILFPPVRNTSPMRLHPARLTPIPETPLEMVVESSDRQIFNTIAQLDRAQRESGRLDWLYAEPPEHAPLILQPMNSQALASADQFAVSRTTDKPGSALMELAELAAQFDPDKTEMAIPVYISNRARQMQRQLRESE